MLSVENILIKESQVSKSLCDVWIYWYGIVLLVERPTESNIQVRRTWGPSSLQKKDKIQHRRAQSPTANGWMRFSRSAPNLPKTLSCMGDQSIVRAVTDLGLFLFHATEFCCHIICALFTVAFSVYEVNGSNSCITAQCIFCSLATSCYVKAVTT